MNFAIEIHADDHAAAIEILAQMTEWKQPPGRHYSTAQVTVKHALLEGCSRAFFIKIAPGGHVYKHCDPVEVSSRFDTDHIVVQTNDRAFNCWEDEGEKSIHLDLGKRYRIVNRGVKHWAVNDGDTDRIHLLIEYRK